MMRLSARSSGTFLAFLLAAAVGFAQAPAPPVAAQKPYAVVSPHGTRNDPYYWLRDDTRSRPEVLDYLKAENAYYEAMSAPYRELTETLAKELIGRVKEDDSTVPYKDKDYLYSTRYEAGKQHPIHVRRPVGSDREQVLVDANREAEGKEYYRLAARAVSPRQDLLAFTEDTGGRFQYTLRFREIASGRDLPGRIAGLRPGVVWADDNRTVYYVENDPVTLLSTRVKKHVLGTDPKSDPVVYEEKDTSFYLGVDKTGDDRFILIRLGSTVASEVRFIAADDPAGTLRVLAPRETGVLYEPDHIGERWVIRTDWKAPNFRLMTVADADVKAGKAKWQELISHDPEVFLESFVAFKDHLAVSERSGGLLRLRYAPWAALDRWTYVRPDEPAFWQGFSINAEQDTPRLRYAYSSLVTPTSVYEIDMRTGERTLLKRQPVPGYDPAGYVSERIWAPARNGARVPVSLVYRKGFARNGTAPLYQYGYGSYGATIDPVFDSSVVSLLDRGFVYAIAHIRGGQELGRAWYDDGHLLKKKNTFTDFIDVTDFLVREKYAAPDKVFASGSSAGGLLMGAVANMAGEKYRGIAAHVPYVDAVTTMLDESIPLVTNEFEEWGNPKQKVYYDYLLSYSPYDNVRAQPYPAMLVTTGLHDSQVQYYEPAKWVARLRSLKTDDNPLLFKINMAAGHGGRSGRFERLKEVAQEYAFFLHEIGMGSAQTLRIVNARLIDGTGAPARPGSLRVEGDRIAAVGDVEPIPDEAVFDAKGLVLAPGFIDTHSHADRDLLEMPEALGAVSQGITTVIGGQDGGSAFPLSEHFARLERGPPAVNVASYSGHGTLREKVMGEDFRRAATAGELAEMSRLLESDLAAGALGLSTGLEYDPGIYSTRDELLALARIAARHRGRYISHIRSEDRNFWEAIDEILAIGREAKLPVQISHIKLAMRSLWNQAPRLLALLDGARAQGIDVTADIYPYLYWHSTLTVLFPERDFENLETARQVLAEIAPAEGLLLGRYLPNPSYAGRTVADIAKERGEAPETTLIALIRDAEALRRQGKEDVESVIGTSMIESDLEALLAWPHTNLCTDGELDGRHPRGFGAYPRVLGRYVRERGVLSLEEAVRKMTFLAADHAGLADRGRLVPGAWADLVLFDPEKVIDRATTSDPHALATGIERVWVNGQVVYANGSATGLRPGRVLRRE